MPTIVKCLPHIRSCNDTFIMHYCYIAESSGYEIKKSESYKAHTVVLGIDMTKLFFLSVSKSIRQLNQTFLNLNLISNFNIFSEYFFRVYVEKNFFFFFIVEVVLR